MLKFSYKIQMALFPFNNVKNIITLFQEIKN